MTVESARAAGRALIARSQPAIAALGPGPGLKARRRSLKVSGAAPHSRGSPRAIVLEPSRERQMALFRTVSFAEPLPAIEGNGVVLRAPQMADFPEWAALRERSRDFLTPWEPTWPADDLTRAPSAGGCAATPRTCARTRPTRSSSSASRTMR